MSRRAPLERETQRRLTDYPTVTQRITSPIWSRVGPRCSQVSQRVMYALPRSSIACLIVTAIGTVPLYGCGSRGIDTGDDAHRLLTLLEPRTSSYGVCLAQSNERPLSDFDPGYADG